MLAAVIMAGGKGERFWPKSRIKLPKQLLKLTGEDTMIQSTVKRISRIVDYDNIYIVTNPDYASIISNQLPEVPTGNILVEPMSRNTAACIGLAALHIEKRCEEDAVMMVLPSDHMIRDEDEYIRVLEKAAQVAQHNTNIVTIGIKPDHPETGYGYIKMGQRITARGMEPVHEVEAFVEKPDKETAEKYLETGQYLWNSGMFLWKVSTIMKNIKIHMPKLYKALSIIRQAIDSDDAESVLYKEYEKLDSISIDYGIMEKADSVYVIPADFGWDDVGSWTALERIEEPDENGNIIKGNILSVDTKKCIIQGGNNKLLALLGLEDLIVVDTDDVTLICPKDRAQDIKKLLQEIRERQLTDYL
jgi:mannose-1-phosphate guanylyltransferase